MVLELQFSDWVSIAALSISLMSLLWTIHIGYRDRPQLIARSAISVDPRKPYIAVNITNHGRRPVVLRYLKSIHKDGTHEWTLIKKKGKLLRLQEGESYEITLSPTHPNLISKRTGSPAVNLRVDDTLNQQYEVRNAKHHLRSFFQENTKKNPGRPMKRMRSNIFKRAPLR